MKKSRLPRTDSIEELANFWDQHDLTGFDSELEEVTDPVFERRDVIQVHLKPRDATAVKKLAKELGISPENLVCGWILQRLAWRNGTAPKKRRVVGKTRKG